MRPNRQIEYVAAANEALSELLRAKALWPSDFASAHEGYAIAFEEVDEFWDHVKLNQKKRDPVAMRKEAIQAAAMFLRIAVECCSEETCRK